MEFKGTNQVWQYRPQSIAKNGFYIETTNKNHIGTFIGEVGGGLQDLKEIEANALLISKAPEMLEMLKEFIDSLCGEQTCEEELIKGLGNTIYNSVFKAKQLINEATKID
jgi:hypothetical protein